ncbi:hypothetical protein CYMTET_18305 [Cymbomonas tetramitiformis]|uniref:Uncharacterized protein n=1 Tax=Cymbomonas tetramitiformis TaxID=36881 RepID=A0AAE0L621_9CHLO|nr:hypothetical protein CYMTET_18305 [Cymbomonas tetramitiformis]
MRRLRSNETFCSQGVILRGLVCLICAAVGVLVSQLYQYISRTGMGLHEYFEAFRQVKPTLFVLVQVSEHKV